MTVSSRLGNIGVQSIHAGDKNNLHDGYAELYVEVPLSINGGQLLEEFLTTRVKGIEGIFISGTTIKVVAKKHKGKQLDTAELKKLAHSATQAIKTWAERQDEGDLTFIISQHNRERELEAMATNSQTRSHRD